MFNVSSISVAVPENVPVGTFVCDFEVRDRDTGLAAAINFSLSGVDFDRHVLFK